MKKRIITCTLSLCTAMLSAVSLSAAATTSVDFNAEEFKNCIKLEDTDWSPVFSGKWETVYMRSIKNSGATFYFVESYPDMIEFKVSKNVDEDKIEHLVKGFDDRLILQYSNNTTTDDYDCTVTLKNAAGDYDKIDSKTAKNLYNILSEYVGSFDYKYDRYVYSYGVYEYMTVYEALDYNNLPLEQKLNEYLEKNEVNASLVKYSDGDINSFGNKVCGDTFYIIPDNDITIIEHYELAKNIAEETGLTPHGVMPTGLDNINEKVIDVAGAVIGDANCDGEVNLADAVKIMQAMCSSRYATFTPQGGYNADVTGNNDGITNKDALAIQKYKLGLIKSFDE